MLYALGLGDSVAGVTYECDFPEEARQKPVVVNTRLTPSTQAAEIDRQVSEFMARGESLYRLETEMLRKIQPDLIITQDLCRVCAASPGDLDSTLQELPGEPQVLSLNPHTLEDVWGDILRVGQATGRAPLAAKVVEKIKGRVSAVERAVAAARSRPRVLCLEWLDPPFVAGHWVPDMVARAGGTDVLGRVGAPGFRSSWEKVLEPQPEVVVVMPCGYDLERTVREFQTLRFAAAWDALPAVRNKRVYAADPSSYFSRPGPRLADGLEILAYFFHPDLAPVRPPAGSTQTLY